MDISPISGPVANTFLVLINALLYFVKFMGRIEQYPEDYSYTILNVS